MMRLVWLVLLCVVCHIGLVPRADAQAWSLSRERPSLFEIVAVDPTGGPAWPYGQEDLAGDGIATLEADEAAADLRSLYADARGQRLWLRAYVTGAIRPRPETLAFFFIDADARASTGGKASDTELWPLLSADPSTGGYEYAIAVRGDETLAGVYRWNTLGNGNSRWTELDPAPEISVESDVARDPLRLFGDDHGYLQVSLTLASVGLDQTCAANFFVRTWNDPGDAGARSFGDVLDAAAVSCRARLDRFGDPAILRSDRCSDDDSCPADGSCRDGICVFGYECSDASTCQSNHVCTANVCVRVAVSAACTRNTDCTGLVCDDGRCATCSTSEAARSCEDDRVCAPDGSCLNPRTSSSADSGRVIVTRPTDFPDDTGARVQGGAFSCSLASTPHEAPGGLFLLVLTGLFALGTRARRRRRVRTCGRRDATRPRPSRVRSAARWLGVLVALVLPLRAAAQTVEEDIDTQRFVPAATSGGFFQTEGTQSRFPIDPFSLGVWLHYAHRPLIVENADGDVIEKIVAAQLGLDVTAAYAFTRWLELGVHLPLAYLSGDDLSAAALGDVRLLPKFTFLRDDLDGIGLGLLTELRLPTHTNDFTGGARNVAGALRVLLGHRFGLSGFRLGLDLGVLLREGTRYRNVAAASELQAGLGLGYRFDGGQSPVEIVFDLRSAIGLTQSDAEEVSLEAMGGARIALHPEWTLNAAAGLGLLEGFGVPTFRVLAGLRWEPSPNDPDHDGLATSDQLASKQREQLDPNAAPNPDEPAPENPDLVDDAERVQAIREGYDACPTLPEDFDRDQDDDGCPEGDADGDGVLDYLDRCPHEDETINGFDDDDGCPDEGPAQIIIEDGQIKILETIKFQLNSSEIAPESHPIMDQIALALRKHRELGHVEIGGHTDNTGPHELNMRLSRARARSVRQYLLGRGIEPDRLAASGYGPDKPIGDNATEEGRALNRRVEFIAK